MARYRALVLTLLLANALGAAAQSNEIIDRVLAQETATVGSAAYVALSAGGLIADDSPPERAVELATEAGWLAPGTPAGDPATFGQLAHLLMQVFEVKGGLLYRIFPGPRYAAREFAFQGWSPVRTGSGDSISGEYLLSVTGIFLEDQEAAQ